MSNIEMYCRHCGAPMEFSTAQVGQEGPCYRCGGTIRVVVTEPPPGRRELVEAERLMQAGAFEDAVRAYHAVADAHPAERALCYSRVGAALHQLGRHGEAIQWYQAATVEGMDPAAMRESIDQADAARARATRRATPISESATYG